MCRLREVVGEDGDLYFCAFGLNGADRAAWRGIRLMSMDPDSGRFELMTARGESRFFPAESEVASVWWLGRMQDELWLAIVPHELHRRSTEFVVTDIDSGTVSNEDRAAYLRYVGGANPRNQQMTRWTRTDADFIIALGMNL